MYSLSEVCALDQCNKRPESFTKMTDDSARLLFRMNHIIPRNLSSASSIHTFIPATKNETNVPDGPEEVEFQMTWGKVAGIRYF